MPEVYFLGGDVRFDDKLVYASGTRMDTIPCPLNAGLPSQHAMRQRWIRPIKVIGPVQRMTDFEWSVFSDILVEEDIVAKLQTARFTGVEFQPVQLYTTTETPIGRQLFELKVTGWGGMAHPSSGIRVRETCSFCGRTVYTECTNPENLFDIDKWDGSDFFLIWPMPRRVFITEEVATFMRRAGFTGLKMCSLDSLSKSPSLVKTGYTPGHVEDWYDGEKAAEILKSLKK